MHSTINVRHSVPQPRVVSPLMLSDQLLSLAEDAHRSGLPQSAARLIRLAHTVCTDHPGMR